SPDPTPDVDTLIETRAGLALAHGAWAEGAGAMNRFRSHEEHCPGDVWSRPVNPYSAPLLRAIRDAPAPSPSDEGREALARVLDPDAFDFPEECAGDIEIARSRAGDALSWFAARSSRPALPDEDREALIEQVSDWLADAPGASHGIDITDEGHSQIEVYDERTWEALAAHLADRFLAARSSQPAPSVTTDQVEVDDDLVDTLRVAIEALEAAWIPRTAEHVARLRNLLAALEPENTPTTVDPAELRPWDHDGHRPVQHRDGKPPWCNDCGWSTPLPAVPATQLKVMNEGDR
uniref:hypothetical protein n=1 Tax=Cellulomonas sp. HZM TaxID=1454010 RepID=UPI0004937A21